MAELNKIRFLLFVSLMTFPAHALDVIFLSANEDFKQRSEIRIYIENREKVYCGTLDQLTYRPEPDTSKVIVYIINRSRFVEIARNAARETRMQIARVLSECHCELVFLGIDNFHDDEYNLVTVFMADKIGRYPDQSNVTIETIGENNFDRSYRFNGINFRKFRENAQICGGTLIARLRNIPHGAVRPAESDDKEIKLRGFHPTMREVVWPVIVINNTYSPQVNVSDSKHNFRIRYKTKEICLLIISGNEYSKITSYGGRLMQKARVSTILEKMTDNNEGLIILGAFNFHWTDIDILTQIILKHSKVPEDYEYRVFTYGYGMFNTNYLKEYVADRRNFRPLPKSNITELIEALMGDEVKERAIKMYFSAYGWKTSEMPIQLDNGHYVPAAIFKNYTFPWVDQKIVFIVYNSTEAYDQVDIPMVYRSMRELKEGGINAVVIEAINFGLDDIHIIAEWIDCHRQKVINAEQVAVFGCGNFDTIFQSKSTTYNTLVLNAKKYELERIRNAYVKEGNRKRIFAARIDDPKCEVWTYPMNTINGFYEPDLIPDQNMFDATGRKDLFFIITSAYRFHRIATMAAMGSVAWFRREMAHYYPCSEWQVFLVGLDNFEERDYHLFAELVKKQTNYGKLWQPFVRIFSCGIGPSSFQYKDTLALLVENRTRYLAPITSFMKIMGNAVVGSSSH